MAVSVDRIKKYLNWESRGNTEEKEMLICVLKSIEPGNNYLDSCMYIVTREEMENPDFRMPAVAACCDYRIKETDLPIDDNTVLIFPPEPMSFTECERQLIECFAEENSFNTAVKRLYDAFASRKGVQNIIDISHEIFDNPIFVMNNDFKTIAYAGNIPGEEMWSNIAGGHHNLKSIKWFDENGPAAQVGDHARVIVEEYSPNPYILSKISIEGRMVGFASIIQYDSAFKPRDTELMDILCKIVGLELQVNSSQLVVFQDRRQYFLRDLIEGSISAENLDDRLAAANMKPAGCYHMLAINIESPKDKSSEVFIQDALTQIIPYSCCIHYNGRVTVFFSGKNAQPFSGSVLHHLKQYMKEANVTAGLSMPYTDILETGQHYEEAVNAMVIGRLFEEDGPIYEYQSHLPYQLFHFLSEEGVDLSVYYEPVIKNIKEYDREYGTKYLETLVCYLKNRLNSQLTSEQLQVHRNTVDYRLGRLHELFGIDFESHEKLFNLFFTIHMMNYCGLKKQAEGKHL